MKAPKNSRPLALVILGAVMSIGVVAFSLEATGAATPALAAPTIVLNPANPAASTSATFTFTGPAGATFQCQLDGATFTTCTSPKSYSALTQGSHTFGVKAVSGSKVSGTSNYTWTVDTVAPLVPLLDKKPSDPTFNATNIFTWTAESGARFQCSVENGSWTTCTSPYNYVIVTSNYGLHQFSVRAVDAAGNASAATSYSFKYEKGLPTTGVPFQITGSVSGMVLGVWQPIAITITNPNGVLIYVSTLNVVIAANSTPAGCYSAANVELQQSNVSNSLTVEVPANGSVVLPSGTVVAPRIRLIDLPKVNQDLCKGKSFTLTYSGTAND